MFNRFERVVAAGREESALISDQWGERKFIDFVARPCGAESNHPSKVWKERTAMGEAFVVSGS